MSDDFRQKPGSPEEVLAHHGIKGMKWGIRKEDVPAGAVAKKAEQAIGVNTPEYREMMGVITRTRNPQAVVPLPPLHQAPKKTGSRDVQDDHQGLSRNQKVALTVGGIALAAGVGYVAYRTYQGGKLETLPGFDPSFSTPDKWNVSALKHGPLSNVPLGMLSKRYPDHALKNPGSLMLNTSRGFADFIPKDGFTHSFAAEQHDSVVRMLEGMREKYPAVRNMNIEVVPASHDPNSKPNTGAFMSVLAMGKGEARIVYDDVVRGLPPDPIGKQKSHIPGMYLKDYLAQHEMGHILAVAHGDLPPTGDALLSGSATPTAFRAWSTHEQATHKATFAKFGFSFEELSKLGGYASTEPAEAMAELYGHYTNPGLRGRLTPQQLEQAERMFNAMGGLDPDVKHSFNLGDPYLLAEVNETRKAQMASALSRT